jgi:DNA (cytosine-5)-methyltransferase 1
MNRPRFAELFAGAGGLTLGLERAGWVSAWHAEIADAPRAILTHHWPKVPLYGDVTTLDGEALTALHGPITLLAGGSPCQDLSVAGKRAGMTEGSGTRSSLFYEQVRLWDETGADLCLWENVDGARSSNNGKDFGEVLRAFVGAAVLVPSDGWRSAGVAAGPRGVAAWRVLDAQYFGVPQRRRRVFVLGTRGGRIDPATVLSLGESMRGNPQTRHQSRQTSSAPTQGRIGAGQQQEIGSGVWWDGGDVADTFGASSHLQRMPDQGRLQAVVVPEVVGALCAGTNSSQSDQQAIQGHIRVSDPVAFHMIQKTISGSVSPVMGAKSSGTGVVVPVAATLDLSYGAKFGCDNQHVDAGCPNFPLGDGVPRRLTPIECERLMSWDDNHTLVPDAKGKLLSDAARYKACGNGVASNVAQWIGERLRLALEAA